MTSSTAAKNTIKNRCTFYYFDENPNRVDLGRLTLNDLVIEPVDKRSPNGWLTDVQFSNIANKHAHDLVWSEGAINTSDDLLPPIANMFNPTYERVVTYRLSDKAAKLVGGKCVSYDSDTPKQERIPAQISLKVSKSAQERISKSIAGTSELMLSITDTYCCVFKTGASVLAIEVTLSRQDGEEPNTTEISEAVASLARFNRLHWFKGGKVFNSDAAYTLGTIARSLLGHPEATSSSSRTYSTKYVEIENTGKLDEQFIIDFGIRLSHSYTSDYAVAEDFSLGSNARNFNNVFHSVALEGAATITYQALSKDSSVEFIDDYFNKAIKSAYLPLHLLLFHEHNMLLQYARKLNIWFDSDTKSQEITKSFSEITTGLLNFRTNFQFPIVSRLELHNQYYNILRDSFSLDELLNKLQQDSDHIASYLENKKSAMRNWQIKLLSTLAVFGVTFLSVYEFCDVLFNALGWFQCSGPNDQAQGKSKIIAVILGLVSGSVPAILLLRDKKLEDNL